VIKSFNIKNTATFDNNDHLVDGLKPINFFYGSNGAGKSTIGKLLTNSNQYSDSDIDWDSEQLKVITYNRDFVERNYLEKMPGIFTLGTKAKEAEKRIAEIKEKENELRIIKRKYENELNGTDEIKSKSAELSELESKYTDTFWKSKTSLSEGHYSMEDGLEGCRSNKGKFKTRLLEEYKNNDSEQLEKDKLEEKAKTLFSSTLNVTLEIDIPAFDSLVSKESNPILKKVIVGKEDVDIAALINKLNNSDWVQVGVNYAKESDGLCPFCQRKLPENFTEKIADFFDETYSKSKAGVISLFDSYSREAQSLIDSLTALLDAKNSFVDNDKLKSLIDTLKANIDFNKSELQKKKDNLSIAVELKSTADNGKAISGIICDANKKIQENNTLVENIKEEKAKLINQIWKYIVEEQRINIETYTEEKSNIENSIVELEASITDVESQLRNLSSERKELEKNTTSVIPTAYGINELLSAFGYSSFSLSVSDDERSYVIKRDDGSLANNTLSEGEKNFISFLYFFYLLSGSQDEDMDNEDAIIVIDDPVSSLDNDVLFIISSLIRDMFDGICKGESRYKQMFILSHNIFFFKEVTYFQPNWSVSKKCSYWIVWKNKGKSQIQKSEDNPVTSTYEMLWKEVRAAEINPAGANLNTLPNTMRRILEHYFQILGGIKIKDLSKDLPDGDRKICKSLLSWSNSGSHAVFEDYACVITSPESLQGYLKMFKRIFEQTNQITHYNMMMRIEENTSNMEVK